MLVSVARRSLWIYSFVQAWKKMRRGKSNSLQCIKKYLEVLTQWRFPATSIRAVWIYRQRGEYLRLCCAQVELEKEIRNLRFTYYFKVYLKAVLVSLSLLPSSSEVSHPVLPKFHSFTVAMFASFLIYTFLSIMTTCMWKFAIHRQILKKKKPPQQTKCGHITNFKQADKMTGTERNSVPCSYLLHGVVYLLIIYSCCFCHTSLWAPNNCWVTCTENMLL